MTTYDNKPQRVGTRSAAKQELNDLRRLAPVSDEFLETLETNKVSQSAQRAILSTIADLSVPSARLSPREIANLTKRFINHVEHAVEIAGGHGMAGGAPGSAIAHELGNIIDSLEERNDSRGNKYDHLIIGELAGLASCLTRREDEWKPISKKFFTFEP